jgi:hypothetical protein
MLSIKDYDFTTVEARIGWWIKSMIGYIYLAIKYSTKYLMQKDAPYYCIVLKPPEWNYKRGSIKSETKPYGPGSFLSGKQFS